MNEKCWAAIHTNWTNSDKSYIETFSKS